MVIRKATKEDLDQIAAVEGACFVPEEAASREQFKERLSVFADHFWLMLTEEGKLISFVDGFVSDQADLTDEMFAKASMHQPGGSWQMIFGVNTLPEYRRRGYAGKLVRQAVEDARAEGRKGVVLTCKKEKLPFYLSLGFTDEGPTEKSVHGGAEWNQMRITF